MIWHRRDHPGGSRNFHAFHAVRLREVALVSRATDGGVTGATAHGLTTFRANSSAFGNRIVAEPDRTLAGIEPYGNGSGNQPP